MKKRPRTVVMLVILFALFVAILSAPAWVGWAALALAVALAVLLPRPRRKPAPTHRH